MSKAVESQIRSSILSEAQHLNVEPRTKHSTQDAVASGIASATDVNASNIKVYNLRSMTTDTSKVTVQV